MIDYRDFEHLSEPFPYKLYIQELEIELAVAENTIRETEEAFQYLRNDYHNLREHAAILEELLRQNGISFPEFYG